MIILCATCEHPKGAHADGERECSMSSWHGFSFEVTTCSCEEFVDPADLTFNLQEEAGDG